MKFAHIADTHIKNLKYHFEYREVFKNLYQRLRDEQVDYIIHCGDIAHTKTQLSPEFVEMCSNFLLSLASIAPTYVILGNHDGNLKNSSRQDAITPIVEALNESNLFLLKNSGEINLNGSYSLNVLSVFDRDNWISPSDLEKINIALYHGAISNSRTDLGWIMEYGEDDISIFQDHDYAFLGDIHKTNQILDHDGKIRYAGSTVQQNHGETNDKGFLVWDIEDKDSYMCKHISLDNPKPFITVELTPKGRLPNKIEAPNGARIRLVSNNNLPLTVMKKAVEVAKHRFKPESITFLNRAAGERGNVDELTDGLENDNLRDPAIQEELIKEYLKDYQPEDDLIERVLKLNSKYNSELEQEEEVNRNINWRLESFEWDNLFNYGEGNKIDFNKLSGIVGIFGKNYSGKSSIIDGILYTLFNSTSKNERKNLNIINQNKESCQGQVKIGIGNKTYTISRTSEKYTKKLKGEETLEAKTDLNFECYDKVTEETVSLNGLTRADSDRMVRKHFGTMEDFLLTSMSSQLGSLQFISEGSTERKKILAKFLDLEVFDQKFKIAKEEASDLRGALKRLEGKEFDQDIFEAEKETIFNENETKEQTTNCKKIKKEIKKLDKNQNTLNKKIDSIPTEIINIEEVLSLVQEKDTRITETIAERIETTEAFHNKTEFLTKIDNFISNFDIEEVRDKKQLTIDKQEKLNDLINQTNSEDVKLKNQEKKAELLKEVPCGSEYSHCKFIKDAYVAVDKLSLTKGTIEKLNVEETSLQGEIRLLNPEQINDHLQKYDQLLTKKVKVEAELRNLKLLEEKNDISYKSLTKEVEELNTKSEEYYKNKEIIENKENLIQELAKVKQEAREKQKTLKDCEELMLNLYKEHGSLEQRLTSLKDDKQELEDLREEYSAYDLFMRCMHSSGISYDIIKKKLPVINNEIAKVLANVVNFEIFFEDDGKRLKIFIKHPKHEPRPMEMGSGAEKTIAAMAMRLALLSVSNLPKSNVFILDEPGTSLDAENMEGFTSILELIKSYFKVVLLVSHLDSLKDCVDMQITIDKNGDYAHVFEK
jgi:DNA repair exonuclease SbcCD ATPase subunit/DNA repair exonuclease SbcCD nuclease subunit